jgi:hypothetical protein
MNNRTLKLSTRKVVGLALLLIYAPYGWLLVINCPWYSERWHFVKMWPVLPGVVANCIAMPLIPHSWRPWNPILFYGIAFILTALIFAATSLALRQFGRAAWAPVVVAAISALSCLSGLAAYALFRS